MEQRKFQEALSAYDCASVYFKNDILTFARGICNYELKNYVDAISLYESIKSSDSALIKTAIHNNLGLLYAKTNKFAAAEREFKIYESQKLDSGRAFRNWAAYYALRKDKKTAKEYLRKAVKAGYNDLSWLMNDESMAITLKMR